MVSSFFDIIYINIESQRELDIDDLYGVADIRKIIQGDGKFYILANKRNKVMGNYLLSIAESDVETSPPTYLINWKQKLDIADADIFLMSSNMEQEEQFMYRRKLDKVA